MIVPVSVKFKDDKKPRMHLAIVTRYIADTNNLADFRDSMLSLLSSCLASEEIMENFSADSLWWLTQIIHATNATISKDQEEGGKV